MSDELVMWEEVVQTEASYTERLKVEGGYLYNRCDFFGVEDNSLTESTTMCFVPDIDLQRYQSHLRDAYTKGYEDGQTDCRRGMDNSSLL